MEYILNKKVTLSTVELVEKELIHYCKEEQKMPRVRTSGKI